VGAEPNWDKTNAQILSKKEEKGGPAGENTSYRPVWGGVEGKRAEVDNE